jgi:RHS repeat-associated protein
MKRLAILVVFLVIFSSISFAKVVDVPEVNEGEGIPLPLESGDEIIRYHYGGNSLVYSSSGDESRFYYQDRLGSNRVSVNFDGEVSNFKSLPYGQIIQEGIQYGFTGKEKDESGLHYFGARYYDSDLGKFTSVDPVAENEPYSYVRNNPMMFVDPDGMDEEIFFRGVGNTDYLLTARTPSATSLYTDLMQVFDHVTGNTDSSPFISVSSSAKRASVYGERIHLFSESNIENGRVLRTEELLDIGEFLHKEGSITEKQLRGYSGLVELEHHGLVISTNGKPVKINPLKTFLSDSSEFLELKKLEKATPGLRFTKSFLKKLPLAGDALCLGLACYALSQRDFSSAAYEGTQAIPFAGEVTGIFKWTWDSDYSYMNDPRNNPNYDPYNYYYATDGISASRPGETPM